MRLEPRSWRSRIDQRTAVTLALVFGLLAAFAYATYLSYWAGVDISSAFAYQSAVVAAERDSDLLGEEQFERKATGPYLRRYEKLLASDLGRVNAIAQTPAERAPAVSFPATTPNLDALTTKLFDLENRGRERFDETSRANTRTRDLSNALFAIVAVLFAVLSSRLRAAIEEGRSLVERLQRAFISKRRPIENLDVGTVLLSATRGSNIGGDTYDSFTYDGRNAMFFVADVSGKGIEAAVDTALIKYSLRTLYANERDPGKMLSQFAEIYARSAENPESFIVLFLAIIDLADGTVSYASAGHEPAWAVFGQDVVRLNPTGPLVGVEAHPVYETKTMHLRYNECIVLSTDGVTESRDSRGALLGADAVTVWLSEMHGDAQAIADALVRRIRKRSSAITDDLAILVARYAPRVRPGIRQTADAPPARVIAR